MSVSSHMEAIGFAAAAEISKNLAKVPGRWRVVTMYLDMDPNLVAADAARTGATCEQQLLDSAASHQKTKSEFHTALCKSELLAMATNFKKQHMPDTTAPMDVTTTTTQGGAQQTAPKTESERRASGIADFLYRFPQDAPEARDVDTLRNALQRDFDLPTHRDACEIASQRRRLPTQGVVNARERDGMQYLRAIRCSADQFSGLLEAMGLAERAAELEEILGSAAKAEIAAAVADTYDTNEVYAFLEPWLKSRGHLDVGAIVNTLHAAGFRTVASLRDLIEVEGWKHVDGMKPPTAMGLVAAFRSAAAAAAAK